MKNKLIGLFILLLASLNAFATDRQVSDSLKKVCTNFNEILLENTSLLSAQPEAYIGKLYPSIPSHFSFGISVTGTLISTDFLKDCTTAYTNKIKESVVSFTGDSDATVDFEFPIPEKLPLPACAFNLRLGGIKIPFDIGFYGMSMNASSDQLPIDDISLNLDFNSFGGDLRFALLKGNLILPKLSIGCGYSYSYLKSGISINSDFTYMTEDKHINGDLGFGITNHVLFAEAQLSKKILCFIPYAGAKISLSKRLYDYNWSFKSSDVSDFPKRNIHGSSESKFNYTDTQIFGGIGIKAGYFECSFNAACNLSNKYISGGIGINFLK